MKNTHFINRINALLAERGIDKKSFYAACHITSSAFSQWATGKTKPRQSKMQEIADYFSVPIEFLMSDKESNTTPQPSKETNPAPESFDDEYIKFALFGGSGDVTDEMVDEVLSFAEFVKQREAGKRR